MRSFALLVTKQQPDEQSEAAGIAALERKVAATFENLLQAHSIDAARLRTAQADLGARRATEIGFDYRKSVDANHPALRLALTHEPTILQRLRQVGSPTDPEHPYSLTFHSDKPTVEALELFAEQIAEMRATLSRKQVLDLGPAFARRIGDNLATAERDMRRLAETARERLLRHRPPATADDYVILLLAECWMLLAGGWPKASANNGSDTGKFSRWATDALVNLVPTHRAALATPVFGDHHAPIKDAMRRLKKDGHLDPELAPS